MKNRSLILSLASNSFLVFIAVYCAFGALISAFEFAADTGVLFRTWLVSVIVLSAVAGIYRGKGMIISVLVALLFLLWNLTEVIDGAKMIIHEISSYYRRWLPVTVLFSNEELAVDEPTVFLAAAGIAVAFLLTVAICLRRSTLLVIISTAPVVFLTFVISDLKADTIYIFGLIAVYLTVLISSAFNPDDFLKRYRLLLPVFLITVVFMWFTYLIASPDRYDRAERLESVNNRLLYIVWQIRSMGQMIPDGLEFEVGWPESLSGGIWRFNTSNVRIADAGSRIISDMSLLEVVASGPGTFYLRGYALEDFDGRSWRRNFEVAWLFNDEKAIETPAYIAHDYTDMDEGDAPGVIGLSVNGTGDITNVVYRPYYYARFIRDRGSHQSWFYYIRNSIHELVEPLNHEDSVRGVYDPRGLDDYSAQIKDMGVFTEISPATAQELRRIAIEAGIDLNAERTEIVDAVAGLVKGSGSYTLTPDIVPQGEDFALYFLETLQEGYCIHFATAAALMLRALDIPTRFITGYVVNVPVIRVDQTVVVTDRNAHAWVEVFYDDIGWLYLEATPPGGGSAIPVGRPHTPRVEAPESTTSPPDIPDRMPEPTMPTNENVPSPSPGTRPGNDGQETGRYPVWLVNIIIVVICVVICVVLINLRCFIIRRLRKKHFAQKNTNTAVISMWRYISRLSSGPQPTDIEDLALKARFSQHCITEEERNMMMKYSARIAYEIYNSKGEFGQFWMKYVRGL